MKRVFLSLLLFIALTIHASSNTEEKAHIEVQEQVQNKEVIRLFFSKKTVSPNDTYTALIEFNIPSNTHLYWKNPGSIGAPIAISWALPEGVQVKEPLWPTPKTFTDQGYTYFGYDKPFSLLVPLEVNIQDAPTTPINGTVTVSYIVCSTVCIPKSETLTFQIPIQQVALPADEYIIEKFTSAEKMIPRPLDSSFLATHEGYVEIEVPIESEQIQEIAVFPEQNTDAQVDIKKEKKTTITIKDTTAHHAYVIHIATSTENRSWRVVIPENIKSTQELSAHEIAKKEIEAEQKTTEQNREQVVSQPETIGDSSLIPFGSVLILAFIGGFILNAMPCVLPVISLKFLQFIQIKNEDAKRLRQHGMLFTAGVLCSFWSLAIVAFILKNSGQSVGWGFQLQQPFFVATLISILFVMALSLFGVFEFGLAFAQAASEVEFGLQKQSSLSSSFISGFFATFVASACTGPFLGSALGFSISLSFLSTFALFTMMGLGMAIPYLVISFFPTLFYFIPRPGRWMVTLKQSMGFLLIATVIWLIWVLLGQLPELSIATLLFAHMVLAIGVWILGTWATFDRARNVRRIATTISLIFLVLGFSMFIRTIHSAQYQEKNSQTEWEIFSQETLNKYVKEGSPVFVNVTARWCLTCQANSFVLELPSIREIFIKKQFIRLKADWTDGSDTITSYLHSIGRNGVPVYVLYMPNKAPLILPEVLTPQVLEQALAQIEK